MKTLGLPVRFGIMISGLLIAFFLILSLFKAHTNPIYSLFNAVITAFGIYEAIKSFKYREGVAFNYVNGFKVGLISGFIATALFTLFFAVYATEINPDFMTSLLDRFGTYFPAGVGSIVLIVLLMGICTTVVLTLSFMQLFKPSQNLK